MAFAGRLGRAGTPPERLDVSADVTFEKLEPGWRIVSSALTVRRPRARDLRGRFREGGRGAPRTAVPISNALQPDIALSVEATLEG